MFSQYLLAADFFTYEVVESWSLVNGPMELQFCLDDAGNPTTVNSRAGGNSVFAPYLPSLVMLQCARGFDDEEGPRRSSALLQAWGLGRAAAPRCIAVLEPIAQ